MKMAGGGAIRYIPRPRTAFQRGGIGGFRKAVARLGHFARPFAEGLVRSALPIGVKTVKTNRRGNCQSRSKFVETGTFKR